MAKKRIDELPPSLNEIKGDDLIPVWSDNRTERITIDDLSRFSGITSLNVNLESGVFIKSASTITFTDNKGGTFNVTGITTDNFYVTEGSFDEGTSSFTLTRNDGGSVTVTGITTDNFYVTEGSFDEGSSTINLTRNDGGIVSVSGISSDNFYVTGGTYGDGTITLSRNDGTKFDVTGLGSPWSGTTNGSAILSGNSSSIGGSFATADGSNNQALGSYSRAGGFNTVAGTFRPEDIRTESYPIGFLSPKGDVWVYLDIPFDESLLEVLNTTLAVNQKAGNPWLGTLSGVDGTVTFGPIADVTTDNVGGDEAIVLLPLGNNWTGTTGYDTLEIPDIIFDVGEDKGGSQSHGNYTQATGRSSYASGSGNDVNNAPVATGDTSFVHQKVTNGLKGAKAEDSAVLGGRNNDILQNSNYSVIIGGMDNSIPEGLQNVTIIGGDGITATESERTYVKNLNISSLNSGNITNNLGIDSNGNVIAGGKILARRENVRYVDPINGDNTSATANYTTNNFNYPYQTFSAARSDAQAGDLIVLRPGTYTDQMLLQDNVNVYCEEGTIIDRAFQATSNLTSRIYGNGYFNSAGLDISGSANDVDIYFEFDRMDTTNSYGIRFSTSAGGKLVVRGNYMSASVPIQIYNGNKDVDIEITGEVHGFGNNVIQIGNTGTSPAATMTGDIKIKAGKITSTSTNQGGRTCVYFAEGLRVSNPNDYKVIIKVDEIVGSDAAANNGSVASCVWIDGGDNVHIYGDLIGKKAHAIASRGASASYHTGTFNFYNGLMTSDKAVVSSGQKGANGNGWHNLNFENCYFKTTGIGPNYGGGIIETTNNWNSVHGGTPGELFFNNCMFYNESSGDTIFKLDQPFSPSNGINANINNSMLYLRSATGFAMETVQTNKTINYFNTISNVDNDTNIINGLSGITNSFAFNNTINVPNKQL